MLEPRYLTVDDVAELVHVSRKTVQRALTSGDLAGSEIARGKWAITEQQVADWLELKSNRRRAERPLADVTPINPDDAIVQRPRTSGLTRGGKLVVTDDMGRKAA